LGVKILVIVDAAMDIKSFSFWVNRFCCNIQINICAESVECDYTLYIQKAEKQMYLTETTSTMFGLENISDKDYPWIAKYVSQIFEYFFEHNNMCQIHSVSIGDDNGKAIMLIGDYWQGKTSSALMATKKHPNLKILSDYYTVYSNGKLTGYNEMIQLNNSNRHIKCSNEIVKMFDERTYYKDDGNNKTERELVGIVVPHIRANDKLFRKIPANEAYWFLYEKISILISGVAILFQGKVPSISFDNINLKNNRLRIASDLTKVPMYYISSDIESISDEIKNLF